MQETLTRTLNSSERQCEALHTTYQRVVAQEAEAPEADVMAALKVAQLAVGAKAEPKAPEGAAATCTQLRRRRRQANDRPPASCP